MPLRAVKKIKDLIHKTKKEAIRKALDTVYDQVKDVIEEKEEKGVGEGWRRTTTPQVKRLLYESIYKECRKGEEGNKTAGSIKKAIDFFLLIYDTDDAYAIMFHRLVSKLNNERLTLDPKEKYLARGESKPERYFWWKDHDIEKDHYQGDEIA